jgi:hypothetical protein
VSRKRTPKARDVQKLAHWLLHKSLHVCLRAQNQPHGLSYDACRSLKFDMIGCTVPFIAMARHNNGIDEAKAKRDDGFRLPIGSAMPLKLRV